MINYLFYIIEHKKNVFKHCWKRGLYLHAFTHDISKLLPDEFISYYRWFYGDYGVKLKDVYSYEKLYDNDTIYRKHDELNISFNKSWERHYRRNKHHYNHWVGKDMPIRYIKQMLCDWDAMSDKFGGTSQEYYLKKYYSFNMTNETRFRLEIELDLIRVIDNSILDDFIIDNSLSDKLEFSSMNIGQLIDRLRQESRNNNLRQPIEVLINRYLNNACNVYNINIYKLVTSSRKDVI